MCLLKPLCWVKLKPFPTSFLKAIDLSHFKVLNLGQEYVLHTKSSFGDLEELYKEKVMFMSSSCGDEFSLLTVYISRRLAMFNSRYEQWTIIPDTASITRSHFVSRGFYDVDRIGRMVHVSLSVNVSLVAESVCGCRIQKFLVESDVGLLLVDVYLSFGDVDGGDIDEVFDMF
jgi:hypothetical protein